MTVIFGNSEWWIEVHTFNDPAVPATSDYFENITYDRSGSVAAFFITKSSDTLGIQNVTEQIQTQAGGTVPVTPFLTSVLIRGHVNNNSASPQNITMCVVLFMRK